MKKVFYKTERKIRYFLILTLSFQILQMIQNCSNTSDPKTEIESKNILT